MIVYLEMKGRLQTKINTRSMKVYQCITSYPRLPQWEEVPMTTQMREELNDKLKRDTGKGL